MTEIGKRIERERQVLSTMLLTDYAYRQLPGDFSAEDFQAEDYRILFRKIKIEYIDTGQPCRLIRLGLKYPELQALISDVTSPPTVLDGEFRARASALKIHPSLALTDMGNSERYVRLYGGVVRFNQSSNRWYVWNGSYWQEDVEGRVVEFAKQTVRAIYGEAETGTNEDERRKIAKFAMISESRKRITDMLHLSQTTTGVAVTSEQLDTNPYLLNLRNGTIDLRTGIFKGHSHADLITKHTDVVYDPDVSAPFWNQFLRKVFGDSEEVIRMVQRCVGYSLTGDTSEQCLFFCYGTGKNGKTVFFEVMKLLFGDYWQKAPAEMLMLRPNEGILNDVARLHGARLVVCSEVQEGRRLNEAKLKDLTGGDTVVARYLYHESFEFKPIHKLWMYGNHKPVIHGTDEGIWRRIKVIPFTVTIPEGERLPMRILLEQLKAELAGILNWALDGLREYEEIGLSPPEEVTQATGVYREEMDVLSEFFREKCVLQTSASVRLKDLYAAYSEWCASNGETPLRSRQFNDRIRKDGFTTSTGHGNYRVWQGIGLVAV